MNSKYHAQLAKTVGNTVQYRMKPLKDSVTEQARSGLAGLQVADDDPAMLSSISGFMAYDDLVKAKGILDLIVELPSFDAELGEDVVHTAMHPRQS